MILTLAYMLCYLFVAWSQFQIVRTEFDIASADKEQVYCY